MCKNWLKIPNRLGKNLRIPQGGFFWTHTVDHEYTRLMKNVHALYKMQMIIVTRADCKLAKGDITRLRPIMSCAKEILSISAPGGSTRCDVGSVGAFETPGKGGHRGSAIVPLERAMVLSYRLSIVTIVLSVTVGTQFAIECLRRSNQQGWAILGQIFERNKLIYMS